jgi:hypothetical protein
MLSVTVPVRPDDSTAFCSQPVKISATATAAASVTRLLIEFASQAVGLLWQTPQLNDARLHACFGKLKPLTVLAALPKTPDLPFLILFSLYLGVLPRKTP